MMAEITRLDRQHEPAAEPGQRYVRVTNRDHNGFIEFQFSVGDPTLYLEMTLPPAAFDEFCREQGARHLREDEARAVDAAEDKWRYGAESED